MTLKRSGYEDETEGIGLRPDDERFIYGIETEGRELNQEQESSVILFIASLPVILKLLSEFLIIPLYFGRYI